MLKTSVLLDYLMRDAERMKEADGKKNLSANYFFMAVLRLAAKVRRGELPEELGDAITLRELDTIVQFLDRNGIDCESVLADMSDMLHDEEYNTIMDEARFKNQQTHEAPALAKQAGMRVLDACLYLDMILREPTFAIRRSLEKALADKPEPQPEPSLEDLTNAFNIKSEDESDAQKESDGDVVIAKHGAAPEQPEADGEELVFSKDGKTPEVQDDEEEIVFSKDGKTPRAQADGEKEVEIPVQPSEDAPAEDEGEFQGFVKGGKASDLSFDDLAGGLGSTPDLSAQPEPKTRPEPLGKQGLANTVAQTREIQQTLLSNIFGQDHAVNAFVSGYFQAEIATHSKNRSEKPRATFLFAGPPGVGKTFLAESAAKALGLPFQRFDMSEYSDMDAVVKFSGMDRSYGAGKPGNVTGFVHQNPKSVLLFDEIEKANPRVIYLFLQLLDAGRLKDDNMGVEVKFDQTIIILTTNAGKNLYEDTTVTNLSAIPRKTVLKALATDINPMTGAPLFPAAICSRFASGNVIMFNHLGAHELHTIAKRELEKSASAFAESTGIGVDIDDKVATAILLSEGGHADARTVRGRSAAFFHEELYELLRLMSSDVDAVGKLDSVKVDVSLEKNDAEMVGLFVNKTRPEVLIFASPDKLEACAARLPGVTCHLASEVDAAKDMLFQYDVAAVLCDIHYGSDPADKQLLNLEDMESKGHDFLSYVLASSSVPTYLLQNREGEISQEEYLSFVQSGVRDILTINTKPKSRFEREVVEKCDIAYRQGNMRKLAKENKVLAYKTSQTLSKSRKSAKICLFGFKLVLAADAEDSKSILDSVAKPNLHFKDVIGATDAKQELLYFVEYLKNPVKYLRKGMRPPKGVLLYGPPGTGKTMLAKAMAGESDITFLAAEGNQFLKKYVGEGPETVHKLFQTARKYAPAILFVDEIDAIGKDRNAQGDHDVTSDILTAFLTEMDGFHADPTRPVFVLAATNYSVDPGKGKSLDPALLRRFDRRLYVDLPNKEERRQYLELKLKQHPAVVLSPEQIDNIAMRSTGMSLAELEGVFEMALRATIRSESGVVTDAEFEEAFETFNSGEKKTWSPETLERTARHEAGHALLCWLSGDKPSYLTIVARGDHGGYMQHADNEGKMLYTRAELRSRIVTSLAGRAAEIVYYGDEDGISTGASGDLQNATRTAENMICYYGMDTSVGMSFVDVRSADAAYVGSIRARVNEILEECMKEAIRTIHHNREAIDALVEALLTNNHLKGNEIDEILQSKVRS